MFAGYRSPKSSPSQCLISIFKATNETLNFWTHFLPSVYFWYCLWALCRDDDLLADPYMAPMLAYMLFLGVFPLSSAVAHVFNCLSDEARHVCFFLDYAALSMFSLGAALAYKAYVFPESFITAQPGSLSAALFNWFLPISVVNAVVSLAISCESRFMMESAWKKLFRFGGYAAPYFFTSIPVFYRIFSVTNPTDLWHDPVLFLHLRQFVFGLAAALLYTTHLPERLSPGSFDIIGHSHQLFHVCTILGCNDQLAALSLDARRRRAALSSILPPRPMLCGVLMVGTGAVCVAILVHFVRRLYEEKRHGRPIGRCPSVLDLLHSKKLK